ncbi:unnamed protein product, partial [Prorocentrum cordatum]
VGQKFTGRVQLVTGFGAFVDIGADQEGLVERARITEDDDPAGEIGDLLQVGQQVEVWVSHLRGDQLGLTMVESKIADSHLIGKAVGLETDIRQFYDIPTNQWLEGQVAEIPTFGWFSRAGGVWVDVTLESGATARGELLATRMRDPDGGYVGGVEDVEVGQTVRVRILGVDVARRRMTLTMCSADSEEDVGAQANFELGAFFGVPKDQWLEGEVSGEFSSGHVVDVALASGAFARGLLYDSQVPQCRCPSGEGLLAASAPAGWSMGFVTGAAIVALGLGALSGGFVAAKVRLSVPAGGPPGQFHHVRYNIGGPAIYHERLTLLPGYILTPDGDHYAEGSVASRAIRPVHILSGQGEGLPGVPANHLYQWQLPRAADVWSALRRASAQGFGLLPASPFSIDLSGANVLGLAAGPFALPDPLAPVAAAAVGPAPPALPAPVGGAAPPAAGALPAAAAPAPLLALAAPPAAGAPHGGGGLGALAAALGGGTPAPSAAVAVPPGAGGGAAPPVAASAGGDPRVMALALGGRGFRDISFSDAVKLWTETVRADWPLTGPRTLLWVLGFT